MLAEEKLIIIDFSPIRSMDRIRHHVSKPLEVLPVGSQ